MNPKREALLGRFRARSLDRLRRTGLALIELEEGRGGAELVEEIARELHTLKGDSRVVGFDAVSELVHLAEDQVLAFGPGAAPALSARVRAALESVARVLRQELAGEEAEAALWREAAVLRGAEAAAPAPPASGTPAVAGPAAPPEPTPDERWTYVKLSRVDEICERVSDFSVEFRLVAFRLAQLAARGASAAQLRPLAESLDRCRSKLDDSLASVWSLRLVPVEPALEEMVGHARDLAQSQGKRVRVTVRGGGAEVERGVLEALREPLLHLVRNAVDHGLESPADRAEKGAEGHLRLEAASAGSSLTIEVTDDGRGVDLAAVRAAAVARGLLDGDAAAGLDERGVVELLFRHGFSTRSTASEVSGRGVGLDVVRDRLDSLGGTAEVATSAGRGTTFKLTVPATISREAALIVECAGALYGLPSAQVLEVVRLEAQHREVVSGGTALRFRNELVPLRSLAEALGAIETEAPRWAVVLQVGGRRWALAVSKWAGDQQLLRRPVDALLATFEPIAASATLDDGRLVLLLSPAGLVRRCERRGSSQPATAETARGRPKVLVVDDSATIVDLVSELLADAGFEVEHAGDGQAALGLMQRWMPELVLADVDMPVMNGFELLEQLRRRWPELPVVMLTTRGSADDRRRAASLGASAYLVKSQFEEATLVETLRRFLRAAA